MMNIPDQIIEQLRCFQCKAYLSCGPVRILPNNASICGRCVVLDSSIVYSNTLLEKLLSSCTFPCTFESSGCVQRCRFNCAADHELSCIYRSVSCPSNAVATCSWEGPIIKIPDHFSISHKHFVKPNATIKIKLNASAKGLVLVKQNNELAFVVKYFYCKQRKHLVYDAQCIKANSSESTCDVEIKNCSSSSTINLKGKKCTTYAENFLCNEDTTKLLLEKFAEILSCTWYIEVKFNVTNSCEIGEQLAVDTDALVTIRCRRCQYYLVPPVYNDDANYFICKNCSFAVNCHRCTQKDIEQYYMGLAFPCRWRGCEHVARGSAIRSHEVECEHRMYSCFDPLCRAIEKRYHMIEHLHSDHHYIHCADGVTFTVNFAGVKVSGNVFTMFMNEFVSIHYYGSWWKQKLIFSSQHSCINPSWATIELHFEHNHCKCTSKTFDIMKSVIVSFSELPLCFQAHEDLTAVVQLIVDDWS